MSDPVIRVLVIDDSAYVRKVMRHMLAGEGIEVVGTARDGEEALELVEQLQPDVVTLDLIMPRLDGLGFLRAQQARRPLPVLVVSLTSEGGEMALAALDAGAFDFLQKPTALATEKIYEMRADLLAKVRAAAQGRHLPRPVAEAAAPPSPVPARPARGLFDVVVLGISTGGPQALRQLIPQLPAGFPVPVVVVLHMPVGYTEMYAHRLNEITPLAVIEAGEGSPVVPGQVLIAPAGQHLTFVRQADGSVVTHLDTRPFDTPHRPAVDVLFQSAASVFHERVLGVVMTGMGNDGQAGAAWIKAEGGQVFTEDEASCVVYGMPRAVVEAGCSDRQIPLDRLAQALVESV